MDNYPLTSDIQEILNNRISNSLPISELALIDELIVTTVIQKLQNMDLITTITPCISSYLCSLLDEKTYFNYTTQSCQAADAQEHITGDQIEIRRLFEANREFRNMCCDAV